MSYINSNFLSFKSYLRKAKWSGTGGANCTNPKILHENVMMKAEEIITELAYVPSNSIDSFLMNISDSKLFKISDFRSFAHPYVS